MNPSEENIRAQLEKYLSYLSHDPNNPNLVAQVADFYYQLGEFDNARDLINRMLEDNYDVGLKFRLSNIAIASGHPEEAEGILRELQQHGIDNGAIQYNLAYSLVFLNNFSEARDILQPLVDCNDEMAPAAATLLTRCYHHLGDLDEGIKIAEQYVGNHEQDAEALGVLALICYDAQQESTAKKWAEKAVKLDDTNLEARIALGAMALATQNDKVAENNFKKALQRNPRSGRAWSGMGLTDMLKLDIKSAVHDLKKAVDYMPNHIGTWHALAWCQLLLDDIQGAKESLDKAMEIDHNFGETHGGLAVIAVLEGRLEDAKTLARKAVLLDPDSFSGRFAQSLLASKTDPQKAQQIIQQIFESKPGGSDVSIKETLNTFLRNKSQKNKPH